MQHVIISKGYQHILIHSLAFLEGEKTVGSVIHTTLDTLWAPPALKQFQLLKLQRKHRSELKHILRFFNLQSQCGVDKSIWRIHTHKGDPY